MKKALLAGTCLAATAFLSSCGSSESNVEVVDLDVVLDEFIATAELQQTPADADQPTTGVTDTELTGSEAVVAFNKDYAAKLNEAGLASKPVAVTMRKDGAFLGFLDENENSTKDSGETDLFTVEVDSAKNRLIATDLVNEGYHRDSGFRMGGGGFLAGYLVSRMMTGQSRMGVKPSRFSNMKMQSKGYHASAAKSIRSGGGGSARSSSGSKSFRSGK